MSRSHVPDLVLLCTPTIRTPGASCDIRVKLPLMQREELDQVRRLYRLFLAYERVESCEDRLPAGERASLVPALAELARLCWRGLFGPTLDTPEHRRFVLGWCLRNVEHLMKEGVLPVIAYQVIAGHIQRDLEELAQVTGAYEFTVGPQDASGKALRRVYLIHSLTLVFARLAVDRQIPVKLQAHLMQHLLAKVRGLFALALGEADANPAALPDLGSILAVFVEAGGMTEAMAFRIRQIDATVAVASGPAPSKMSVRVPMSGSGAGLSSSAGLSRPVALPASDSPTDLKRPEALASTPAMARPGSAESAAALLEMAAAGELMRRLRRASSLGKDDRDRLIKRVETELEDMVEALGSQRLDRAIAALGDRLGIPVPPRSDLSSSGIFPVARPAGESPAARLLPTPRAAAQPDGNPRSGESADYQWAFDLIEDLRADNVEPEGSSGK